MFSQSFLVFALLAATASVDGIPLFKRINQDTPASKTKWEAACTAAGGKDKCNPIAVTAAGTLLAGAGDCDQQNSGDAMIDLAKTLSGDTTEMNKLAQIFVQQPRNTLTGESVPYCQTPPKNQELNGLFQCQFQGTSAKSTFKGGVAVGQKGTIPLGQNAPVNPAGSCPAHKQGPIPDGQQLVDIVSDPGAAAASGGAAANNNNNNTAEAGANNAAASASSADSATDTASASASAVNAVASDTASGATSASAAASTGSASGGAASGGAAGFKAQNGKDAQSLNDSFAGLTADSACQDGQQACVQGSFAQCVGGKFTLTQCGGGTVCKALPLVNKPGTSVTCTTEADAQSRIATALGSA